jgi:hypothetical protein
MIPGKTRNDSRKNPRDAEFGVKTLHTVVDAEPKLPITVPSCRISRLTTGSERSPLEIASGWRIKVPGGRTSVRLYQKKSPSHGRPISAGLTAHAIQVQALNVSCIIGEAMRTLLRDLRYEHRLQARNPGFVVVAVVTLALGIGANTAIFSLVNAVLLRPLPYPDPEQLVGLGQWRDQKGEGYIQTGVSAPNIADIAQTGVFQYVAYFRGSGFNITEGNRPESVNGVRASSELLPMFGVPPMLGRFMTPAEMEAGHDQVAVIGNRLWRMRYGSDPDILGKTIDLDQRRYAIVGVMPASFRFTWDQELDVFIPLVLTTEERSEIGRGTSRDLQTQARIKAGLTFPQAQAAMNVLADTLAREHPAANKGWGIKVEPLHAAYHRHMQAPLLIMLGAVAFVLLIACVNVSNLLLARATGRNREFAIRVSPADARPGPVPVQSAQRQGHRCRLACADVQPGDHRRNGSDLRSGACVGDGEDRAERVAEERRGEHYRRTGPQATAQRSGGGRDGAGADFVDRREPDGTHFRRTGERRPRHRSQQRRDHEPPPARLQVLVRVATGGLLSRPHTKDPEHTRC